MSANIRIINKFTDTFIQREPVGETSFTLVQGILTRLHLELEALPDCAEVVSSLRSKPIGRGFASNNFDCDLISILQWFTSLGIPPPRTRRKRNPGKTPLQILSVSLNFGRSSGQLVTR